jgi:hypothetical protein
MKRMKKRRGGEEDGVERARTRRMTCLAVARLRAHKLESSSQTPSSRPGVERSDSLRPRDRVCCSLAGGRHGSRRKGRHGRTFARRRCPALVREGRGNRWRGRRGGWSLIVVKGQGRVELVGNVEGSQRIRATYRRYGEILD